MSQCTCTEIGSVCNSNVEPRVIRVDASSNLATRIMEFILKGIGAIALFVVLCLVLTFPVMLLWNWLMPVIFKLPEIGLLQALGLTLLSSAFFKKS